jgi:hypothetical protein
MDDDLLHNQDLVEWDFLDEIFLVGFHHNYLLQMDQTELIVERVDQVDSSIKHVYKSDLVNNQCH